jgi:hypothetical protein
MDRTEHEWERLRMENIWKTGMNNKKTWIIGKTYADIKATMKERCSLTVHTSFSKNAGCMCRTTYR